MTASWQTERARVAAALAVVYVVWGSTYLAIKLAVDTIPPMLLGATRFLVAGALLYAWTARAATRRPTRSEWGAAAVAGILMLVGGTGAVTWAEQRIDSGVAALLAATVPLWMVLLARWWHHEPLRRRTAAGLVLGFVGVAVLVQPSGHGLDLLGALVVIGGTFAWAAGSIYSRSAPLPGQSLRATAMQMLAGGAVFAVLGVGSGEASRLDLAAVTASSVAALAYLTVVGSIVAFSAYTWLLRAASPATVSTYAYVNPVVAVLLGAVFLAEPVTGAMLGAGALIVAGVASIVTARRPPAPAGSAPAVTTEREPAGAAA